MDSRPFFSFYRRVARWACLAAGTSLLLVGIGFAIHSALFLRHAVAASATIASLVQTNDEQNNATGFAPVFKFTAEDGRDYTVQSGNSANPPGFAVGQHVQVKYDRSRPGSAEVDSFWSLWTFPTVFGFTGTTAIIVGFALLWYERRQACQDLPSPQVAS
jgi:hypothetical protein